MSGKTYALREIARPKNVENYGLVWRIKGGVWLLLSCQGLPPSAVGSGDLGREIEGPMAIVILGGLATSTALNLVVLPTLALKHGRFERITGVPED